MSYIEYWSGESLHKLFSICIKDGNPENDVISEHVHVYLIRSICNANTVEPRFSVILAANFPLNSKFFSGYQKLILLSKITLNRGLPRFSVAF